MRTYYYVEENKPLGPFSFEELKTKNLNENTLIWYSGLKDWVKIKDEPEFINFFVSSNSPPSSKSVKNKILTILFLVLIIPSAILGTFIIYQKWKHNQTNEDALNEIASSNETESLSDEIAGSYEHPEEYEFIDNEELGDSKQIEWADGNLYSYDFIETISQGIDSNGDEILITVYKKNPPRETDINCEKINCKWCSKEIYAESYEIEEYPNINWVRKKWSEEQPEEFSMFGAGVSMLLEGKKYYDLGKLRIRTKWIIYCNYPGPKGFCSLKCENDYLYR